MTTVGQIQQLVESIGPWFLRNKHIGAFLESMAITYDSAIESLDLGLRLGQPLRCDASALPVLGYDRGIPFYPSESETSKRYRCAHWKQLHRTRGTHIGELQTAQPYFGTTPPLMRIVHQDGAGASATWHTLAADGSYSKHVATPSNWNWDGTASKWSRFWVICYAPAWALSQIHYGDGTRYGTGAVYAGASSSQVATDLVNMIRNWKGAHSRLYGYIIATDGSSFDPTATSAALPGGGTTLPIGNWGSPLSLTGGHTRPSSAIWIYDLRTS